VGDWCAVQRESSEEHGQSILDRDRGNKYPISGGYFSKSNYHRFPVYMSGPRGNTWAVSFTNTDAKEGSYEFLVFVMCADFLQ
jgi:hypothetical protein